MPNLPIAFADLFGGGILLVAGISGNTIADVIRGNVTIHGLGGGGSSGTVTPTGQTAPGGLKGGGQTLKGKVSWFGGPNDPSAGSTTASGAPTSEPGIAVYNQATLGGWWRVTFPNGRTVDLKQTDIGPAPWTGRLVDVTYSALGLAGYSQGDFPTDGTVSAVYLGK